MDIEIREPRTKKEFEDYYNLRYKILRKPWNQPPGSEKDELEDKSIHILACSRGKVIGCSRIHFNSPEEAQIRYMAVDQRFRSKGIGQRMLKELESRAAEHDEKYIVLNAREAAVHFYESNGYRVIGESPTMFGTVKHKKMRKDL